ncbi:hypothetical protein M422DRAFT_33782 [Sphaerobolus stellatus SS14]|uniref:Uncharacterized protein n=1 Tax=Sphaerobolus stellatus (strain SS14) TaxID=990650 RepID=A0A0C9VJF2_SPHS4|nr:hypothetical protein M422DRAFT_33782 [Sphaerobolus stellatus SS14]
MKSAKYFENNEQDGKDLLVSLIILDIYASFAEGILDTVNLLGVKVLEYVWLKLELDGPAGDTFLGSSTSSHTLQDLGRPTAKQF